MATKVVMHGTGFGLGFSVRDRVTAEWDPEEHVGEYWWAGSAQTHYWISPNDSLAVIILEQTLPFRWDTEVKKLIYDAVK